MNTSTNQTTLRRPEDTMDTKATALDLALIPTKLQLQVSKSAMYLPERIVESGSM